MRHQTTLRRIGRALIGAALLATAAGGAARPAGAQDRDLQKKGQAGMAFLKLGVGARPAAMGGAYVGHAGDALALFWNPAGIATVDGRAVTLNNSRWLADVQQNAAGAVVSLGRWGTLGLTANVMDYGTFNGTAISGSSASGGVEYVDTGTFSVSEYALGLAYGYQITDRFSVGAQVKHVASELGSSRVSIGGAEQTVDNDAKTVAVDLGTIYQTGSNGLAFAMSVRNIAGQTAFPGMFEEFDLPLLYTLGVSMDVLGALAPGTDQRLRVGVDGLHPNDGAERVNAGAEYGYRDTFFLRGGYKWNDDVEDFSGGFGVRLGFGGTALQVDYAATRMQYFDAVHRVSLSASF